MFRGGTLLRRLANVAGLVVVLAALAACGDSEPSAEGYVQKAEKRLEADRPKATVIALKNALQKQPEHRRARYLIGKTYLETGRGEAALSHLSKASDLGVEAADLPRLLARAHLAAGQPEDALEIVQAHAPSAALRLLAADAHAQAGRTREARERYTALVAEGTRVVDARLGLARLMLDRRRPREALAHLDRALAQRSDHPAALHLKARAYVMARRPEPALNIIERLRPGNDTAGDDAPERRLSARVRRVQIPALLALDRNQTAAEALAALRKVGDPASPGFKALAARVELAQGNYKAARQAGLAVVSKAPDATRARLTVGLASAQLDLPETARNQLRKVLADHPNRVRARLALADLLLKAGRGAAATDLLQHDSLDYVDAPVRQALETRAALAAGRTTRALESFQGYLASLRGNQSGSLAQIEAIRAAADTLAEDAGSKRATARAALIAGMASYHMGDRERARHTLAEVDAGARLRRPALAYRIAARLTGDGPAAASDLTLDTAETLNRHPGILLTAARVARAAGADGAVSEFSDRLAESAPQLAALIDAGLETEGKSGGSAGDPSPGSGLADTDTADPRTWGVGFARAIRQGDFAAARDLAEKVSAAKPQAPDGPTMAAVAALGQGRADAARTALGKALDRSPADPTAASIRAALAIRAGNLDTAGKLYRRVLEAQPDHAPTRLRLARLRVSQGDLERARNLAERAANDGVPAAAGVLQARIDLAREDGGAALERLRRLEPEDAETRRTRLKLLGRAQLAAGNPDRAAALFQRLAGLMPDRPAVRLLLARAERQAGDTAAALEVLTALIRERPEATRARLLRARLLAQRGDLPRARSDVQELLDENSKSANVRRLAAAVAGAQGRTEARLKHLKRAQALAPTSATAIDRARTLIRLGRLDDGLAALRAWVDRHPDDAGARAALAEQLLAAGRMKPAIRAFSGLPEDMRMRATVQNNLAWAKLKAGQADAALTHAKRAAERSDGDPRILDTKGMVLLALDRPDAARRVLAKAHAGSERPDIALHYAKALARSGAQDKARELLGPVVSAGHLENGAHDEARQLYRSLEH